MSSQLSGVQAAVEGRRNIKVFKSDEVSKEQVVTWFESAKFAPNHRNVEPWEVVFIGPEARKKLNHKADFGGAPLVFAVIASGAQSALDRDENIIAAACFVQNFLLLTHEAGVGVRWASLGSQPQNREILGVADGDTVIGVFGVGYPAEVPVAKARTPMAQKVRELA